MTTANATDVNDTLSDAAKLANFIADWDRISLESGLGDWLDTHELPDHERDLIVAALRAYSPDRDIRAEVIEECAVVAEQYDNYTVDGRPSAVGAVIAAALRGLKSQSSGLGERDNPNV